MPPSAAGIAQHGAIAAALVNPAAEVVGRCPGLSADPDLIARQRTAAALDQDRVPPLQHRGVAYLETWWSFSYNTYLLLAPNTDAQALEKKIKFISRNYIADQEDKSGYK